MIVEFLQIQIPTDRTSGTRTSATQMLTNKFVDICSTPLTTAPKNKNKMLIVPDAPLAVEGEGNSHLTPVVSKCLELIYNSITVFFTNIHFAPPQSPTYHHLKFHPPTYYYHKCFTLHWTIKNVSHSNVPPSNTHTHSLTHTLTGIKTNSIQHLFIFLKSSSKYTCHYLWWRYSGVLNIFVSGTVEGGTFLRVVQWSVKHFWEWYSGVWNILRVVQWSVEHFWEWYSGGWNIFESGTVECETFLMSGTVEGGTFLRVVQWSVKTFLRVHQYSGGWNIFEWYSGGWNILMVRVQWSVNTTFLRVHQYSGVSE